MTSKHVSSVSCRAAERDCELQALAALRAQAFYAYPPERAFAGRVRLRFPQQAVAANRLFQQQLHELFAPRCSCTS